MRPLRSSTAASASCATATDRDGVELGRARLALSQDLGDLLTLKIDASAWGQHDRNPVDLTEAYLQLHPYPVR